MKTRLSCYESYYYYVYYASLHTAVFFFFVCPSAVHYSAGTAMADGVGRGGAILYFCDRHRYETKYESGNE